MTERIKIIATMALALLLGVFFVAQAVYTTPPADIPTASDGAGGKVGVPVPMPNGKRATELTVAKTVKDYRTTGSGFTTVRTLGWCLYTPADCKFAVQSTATIPAGSPHWRTWTGGVRSCVAVNPATPFVRYTGATSGELDLTP